jgi:hypothetical protein
VGEVDEAHDAEHEPDPHGDECVHKAEGDRVDEGLENGHEPK